MSCLPTATQAEAEAGIANDKTMTPLRTKEAIDALGVSQEILAGPTGWEMVGTKYPEPGARKRPFAEVDTKRRELSGFTGADPTNVVDSYAALQAAIEACHLSKSKLIIDGTYRISLNGREPIKILGNKSPLLMECAQHRTSNIPSVTVHQGGFYFDQDAPESLVVENQQLTLDGVAIVGPARVSTYPGIKTTGVNSSLTLTGGAVVQSWQTGVLYESGFYHRINEACIIDCVAGFVAGVPGSGNPIYNLAVHQLKLVGATNAASVGAVVYEGSQVSLSQSSIESCQADGFRVNNSTLSLIDCYFENQGGWNVHNLNNARIFATGNRVYLTEGCDRWISNDGGSTTGVQIVSFGNHFVWAATDDGSMGYSMNGADATAVSQIGPDFVFNPPSANFEYANVGVFLNSLRGQHQIQYPQSHKRAYQPISTMPLYSPPAQSGMGNKSLPGMMINYGVNGFGGAPGDPEGDDPGAWRGAGWGANPMQMVFHKSTAVPDGQWEKVGLRLPYRAPPAADAASVATWIAQFVDDLNKQAVMPSS